jgi:H+/Cl- antiporter ClcA
MSITSLVIGCVVGLFAGLIAFLITYDEYTRHYVEKQTPLRLALEAAAFAFFVFLVLTVLTGFVLTRVYGSQ